MARTRTPLVDPFQRLLDCADLEAQSFTTPGGKRGKPFKVVERQRDFLLLRLSTGGRMRLAPGPFQVAWKFLQDCGFEGENWLPVKDPTFADVLKQENGGKPCTSYVLPLLEFLELIEIDRGRPNKVRTRPAD